MTPAIDYLLATEGGILCLCGFSRSDMAPVRARSSSRVCADAGARTLVDVRRFPASRRNPQFNASRAASRRCESAGIEYRHAVELGGRLSDEPGEERFACIGVAAFRSYAARMARPRLAGGARRERSPSPEPCFMCAETPGGAATAA